MKKCFALVICLLLTASVFGQTHVYPATDTTNAFFGVNTFGNLNSEEIVDGVRNVNLSAAFAHLAGSVGTVRTPPGYSETFTTFTIPTNVQLILGRGTTLTSTSHDGLSTTFAITGGSGSSLLCDGTGIGFSFTSSGCTVAGSGAFNGGGLYTTTPGSEFVTVQGISFRPNNITAPTDVFQKATVWINQVFVNSAFKDNIVNAGCASAGACSPTPAGANGSIAMEVDGSNSVVFENMSLSGLCLGTPLLINGNNNQSLEFIGGAIQFPGAANFIEDINSGGNTNTHDINHFGIHYEQCNNNALGMGAPQTQDAIRVRDAKNILFSGIQINQANGTAAFQLSQSASGLTDNVHIIGFTSQAAQAPVGIFLNNLIRAADNTDFGVPAHMGDYDYIKYSSGTALTSVGTIFSQNGSMLSNAHSAIFAGSLVSGSPSTATVSLVAPSSFTSSVTYTCSVTNNTTAGDSLKIAYTNGTTFVVTGPNSVTDSFSGVCVGN